MSYEEEAPLIRGMEDDHLAEQLIASAQEVRELEYKIIGLQDKLQDRRAYHNAVWEECRTRKLIKGLKGDVK